MDTPPIDGADIVTTIDVSMQDLAESSFINELLLVNGNVGVAIVMDVTTGDVSLSLTWKNVLTTSRNTQPCSKRPLGTRFCLQNSIYYGCA